MISRREANEVRKLDWTVKCVLNDLERMKKGGLLLYSYLCVVSEQGREMV
jgi:hypothetical protein